MALQLECISGEHVTSKMRMTPQPDQFLEMVPSQITNSRLSNSTLFEIEGKPKMVTDEIIIIQGPQYCIPCQPE